jgi:hypothetical protein
MALLDICITEGDDRICQEEARGNIGTLTDINADNDTNVSHILSLTGSAVVGSGEAISIFIT